jgi:hypothetical protein
MKLEKKAELVLPGSEEVGRKREGEGEQEGEMAQIIHAHMYKQIDKQQQQKENKRNYG